MYDYYLLWGTPVTLGASVCGRSNYFAIYGDRNANSYNTNKPASTYCCVGVSNKIQK